MDGFDWKHAPFLLIFASYFLIIIWLFALILRSLPRNWKTAPTSPTIFAGLTVASLGHTWYCKKCQKSRLCALIGEPRLDMLEYMQASLSHYEQALKRPLSDELVARMGAWLHDTSLFKEAWFTVCRHPFNWWWSEQLCLFTVGAWTIFVATEGSRHKVKHLWAYMLVGQIVAISVASNLFYLALVLSPSFSNRKEREREGWASPVLSFNVFLALTTVALVPFITERMFLQNLLIMHGVLFLPLLEDSSTNISRYAISTKALYRIVQLLSTLIHGRTVVKALEILRDNGALDASSMVQTAWRVLHSHPAQSSIGWDVVWTSISFVIWTMVKPHDTTDASKWSSATHLLGATPLASIGVTAPYTLSPKRAPKEDFKFEAKVQ